MTAKEIFESIDLSQLPKEAADKFRKVEKATKGFTIESDKVNTFMRGAYKKIKETKPTALKNLKVEEKVTKKEVKKGKTTEVVENLEYKVTGTKKVAKKTPTPSKPKRSGETAMERARKIRNKGEAWKDALARAQKELKAEADKAKSDADKAISTTSKALKSLEKMIQNDPKLKGYPRTYGKQSKRIDANKDAKIKAKPAGKRVSKKGHKNQYGESKGGRVYWENRDNRSDRYAPNFPNKVFLEMGGETDDLGFPTGHTFLVVEVSPDGTKNLIKSTKDYMTALMSSAVARGMKSNKDARVVIVDKEDKKVIHEAFEAGGEITITPTQLVNNPDALVGTTTMTELFECGGVTAYQEGGEVFVTPYPLTNAGSGDYVAGSNTMSNMFEDGGEVLEDIIVSTKKFGVEDVFERWGLDYNFEGTNEEGADEYIVYEVSQDYIDKIKSWPVQWRYAYAKGGQVGKQDALLAKVADAVKGAKDFMSVGKELKKSGINYSFSTSIRPIYRLDKLPIVIVNKKYAKPNKSAGDIVVGDMVIGLMAKGGQVSLGMKKHLSKMFEKGGFIAIYNGKRVEIDADTLFEAKKKAIQELKVPKSKQGLLSVMANQSMENEDFRFMAKGGWVVYVNHEMKGKELLGTFHSKKAADKYKTDVEDDVLSTKGVDGIGTMSKSLWDKKEAPYLMAKGGQVDWLDKQKVISVPYKGKKINFKVEYLAWDEMYAFDSKTLKDEDLIEDFDLNGMAGEPSPIMNVIKNFLESKIKGVKFDEVIDYYGDGEGALRVQGLSGDFESYAKGGYVAVGEKDGFWTIISTPTTKAKAKELLDMTTLPKGEKGKIVSVSEAMSHKNVLGKEYLESGGTIVAADPSAAMEDLNQTYGYESVYEKGGRLGFEGLAKKVAKRYEGKPVKAKYQKEYGKTYSKEEAMEVGRKVAAKVYGQQQANMKKMAEGGATSSSSMTNSKRLVREWKKQYDFSKLLVDSDRPILNEKRLHSLGMKIEQLEWAIKREEENPSGMQNLKRLVKEWKKKYDFSKLLADSDRPMLNEKELHDLGMKIEQLEWAIKRDEEAQGQKMAKGGSLDGHGLKSGDVIISQEEYLTKILDKDGNPLFVNLRDGYRGREKPLPFAKGGAVGGMKIPDIAKKFGKTTADVFAQLQVGEKHEMEHTNDPKKARKIALDHLSSDLDYYTKLNRLGL